MHRFDYVNLDNISKNDMDSANKIVVEAEKFIATLTSPYAKTVALLKLEEMFMWISTAICDDQHEREIIQLAENKVSKNDK